MQTTEAPPRIEPAVTMPITPVSLFTDMIDLAQRLAKINAAQATTQRQKAIERLTRLAHDGELTTEEIHAAVEAGLLGRDFADISLAQRIRIFAACLQPDILWGYITRNPKTTIRGMIRAAIVIFAAFNIVVPTEAELVIVELALGLYAAIELKRGVLKHDSREQESITFQKSSLFQPQPQQP